MLSEMGGGERKGRPLDHLFLNIIKYKYEKINKMIEWLRHAQYKINTEAQSRVSLIEGAVCSALGALWTPPKSRVGGLAARARGPRGPRLTRM